MADADFFKTRSDFTGGQRRSLYGGNIAAYMICAVTEIYSVGNHVLFAAPGSRQREYRKNEFDDIS